MEIFLLSGEDIKAVLPMREAIATTRVAFQQLTQHQVTMPLRSSVVVADVEGVSYFMPAYIAQENQLGIKIVSAFPNNRQNDLPAVHGIVVLIDTKTGCPKALLDGSELTAIRTGAVSGLATDLLAIPDAQVLAIFGAGVQAKKQLEAVYCVRPITTVKLYSKTKASTLAFAKEIATEYPSLAVEVCDSPVQAYQSADIICTATNANIPFIDYPGLSPHCHINAIGSHNANMHELTTEVLKHAHVIVDQKAAALAEAGEIMQAVKDKQLTPAELIELGSLLNGTAKDLLNTLTIFKSVGLAMQDVAVAERAVRLAPAQSKGRTIKL